MTPAPIIPATGEGGRRATPPAGAGAVRTGQVPVDGGVLTYQLNGEVPDVCMVQDTAFAGLDIDACTHRLRRAGLQVLTYDLRGQGRSPCTTTPVSSSEHAADIEHLLAELGADAVHVVGSSLGTLVARDVALAAPERVAGLTLVGPAFGPLGAGRRRQLTLGWLRVLSRDGLPGLFDALYPLVFSDHAIEHGGPMAYLVFREQFIARSTASQVVAGLNATLAARDVAADLAEITCPVQLIAGDGDYLTSPSTLRSLGQMFPDATTHVLRYVGHLACLEADERVASLVEEAVGPRPTGRPSYLSAASDAAGSAAEQPSVSNGVTLDDPDTGTCGLERKLALLLREAAPRVLPSRAPGALRRLTLDAHELLSFLMLVEDAFRIEWRADTAPDVFESLATVAAHVQRELRA